MELPHQFILVDVPGGDRPPNLEFHRVGILEISYECEDDCPLREGITVRLHEEDFMGPREWTAVFFLGDHIGPDDTYVWEQKNIKINVICIDY